MFFLQAPKHEGYTEYEVTITASKDTIFKVVCTMTMTMITTTKKKLSHRENVNSIAVVQWAYELGFGLASCDGTEASKRKKTNFTATVATIFLV